LENLYIYIESTQKRIRGACGLSPANACPILDTGPTTLVLDLYRGRDFVVSAQSNDWRYLFQRTKLLREKGIVIMTNGESL